MITKLKNNWLTVFNELTCEWMIVDGWWIVLRSIRSKGGFVPWNLKLLFKDVKIKVTLWKQEQSQMVS